MTARAGSCSGSLISPLMRTASAPAPRLRLKDERGPGPLCVLGRRVDRAVALPGGGTSSHPCQDMSPTCWLEPSLTDSVAAEVLGRPSARSAAAADVDGMSRGRWPGAGGSSEDAEGLAEQRPPGLAPRGGLHSTHAVLARPTRAWAERATAWRQDTSSPTGAGTPLPQLRRKLDLPVVQGAGR